MPEFVPRSGPDNPDISLIGTIKARAIDAVKTSVHPVNTSLADMDTLKMDSVNSPKRQRFELMDLLFVLLPLLALGLWAVSLRHVSVQNMNDFGLVSVLSHKIIAALGILVVSFVFALRRREIRPLLLALHIIVLILIIDSTQNLIEEMPRFSVVYRHAGYTEYIMRTGTVNTNLDAYFSWPMFFVLSAFVTKVCGYSTVLSYAGWAPLFNSLIYFGPLYMIFTSITTNKRLVWLSILFFYLTNWIGQEYFSPQGLNFFLYLVIIAMLLKWFRMPPKAHEQQPGQQSEQNISFKQKFAVWLKTPDPVATTLQSWQERGLLCCLILIYGFVVSSHQLTPFFTLASVGLLIIFRRLSRPWLPILMLVMLAAWLYFMAGGFLAGHSSMVFGGLGNLFANISKSTTTRASVGDPQHHIVSQLRLLMTGLIWLIAFLGCIKRVRQGYRDITSILLAIAGFPLIAAQNYGGEMFLRIYLFTLPFMVFFAASLFCSEPLSVKRALSPARSTSSSTKRTLSPWMTAAIVIINLVLLGGFFFTRYGNERVDYITNDEWNGVQYLYQIAPAHSLLVQPSGDTPWQFEDYEKYDNVTLPGTLVTAGLNAKIAPIVQWIVHFHPSAAYIIFTRSQQAHLTAYDGEPDDTLARLEAALLKSGEFKLVYNNHDAQVVLFTGSTQRSVS